MLTSNKPVIT